MATEEEEMRLDERECGLIFAIRADLRKSCCCGVPEKPSHANPNSHRSLDGGSAKENWCSRTGEEIDVLISCSSWWPSSSSRPSSWAPPSSWWQPSSWWRSSSWAPAKRKVNTRCERRVRATRMHRSQQIIVYSRPSSSWSRPSSWARSSSWAQPSSWERPSSWAQPSSSSARPSWRRPS